MHLKTLTLTSMKKVTVSSLVSLLLVAALSLAPLASVAQVQGALGAAQTTALSESAKETEVDQSQLSTGPVASEEAAIEKTWVDTYDALLQKYVTARGVKYKAWHGAPEDRAALRKVITEISTQNISGMGRDEKLAFYLNAYNAWILHRILQDYPTDGPGGAGILRAQQILQIGQHPRGRQQDEFPRSRERDHPPEVQGATYSLRAQLRQPQLSSIAQPCTQTGVAERNAGFAYPRLRQREQQRCPHHQWWQEGAGVEDIRLV